MASFIVPLLFAVIGLLIYGFATNSKLCEVGRLMFGYSWLVVMWVAASHVIRL